MIRKFRHRAPVIDALEWTGDNLEEVQEFAGGLAAEVIHDYLVVHMRYPLGERGRIVVEKGGYLYRNKKGELFGNSKKTFEAEWREVS